jgi:hypothetical protein
VCFPANRKPQPREFKRRVGKKRRDMEPFPEAICGWQSKSRSFDFAQGRLFDFDWRTVHANLRSG